MNAHRIPNASFAALTGLAISFALPGVGFAQAWTSPKGTGTLTLSYQNQYTDTHYFGTHRIDLGHIRLQGLYANLDYSVTDRLGVSVTLPYVAGRYTGTDPHPNKEHIDDGRYHSTFQDFNLDARYHLTARRFAITPFMRTILPSHDYEFFAHSAVGTRLKEVQIGAFVGRRLNPILSDGYFQARYSYGIVERVLGIHHNRSDMDLQAGYFISPRLNLYGLITGFITHGGLDAPPLSAPRPPANDPIFLHHDQIAHGKMLNLGGGASLAVNDRFDVYGSVIHSVTGTNGHAIKYAVTLGMSWSFGRGAAGPVEVDQDPSAAP